MTSLIATGRTVWEWLGRSSRMRVALPMLVLGALGAAISWLRLPAIVRSTIWAEDGPVFLDQAIDSGPWSVVFRVYEGYLHLVPRIAAAFVVEFLPVERYAVAITALSCLLVGAVAALVYFLSTDIVRSPVVRSSLAAVTFLVPAAPMEVLGNLANMHWYLLWLAPWLLLYRPRTWPMAWLLSGVGALAALTEIQIALFLPLALLHRGERKAWPVSIATLGGIVFQLVATFSSPRSPVADEQISPLGIVEGYLVNGIMSVYFPNSAEVGHALVTSGWIVGVVAALPFLASAVFVALIARGRHRVAGITCFLASGALWAATMVLNPRSWLRYDEFGAAELATVGILRYAVIASMFLLAGVLVAIDVAVDKQNSSRKPAFLPGIALGVVLTVMLSHFGLTEFRRGVGPAWSSALSGAQLECESRTHIPEVPVAIAPDGWRVDLPCALVKGVELP